MSIEEGIVEAPVSKATSATVTVLLPSALAPRTGGQTAVAVAGKTVREIVDALEAAYPGLRFNLCYETGELRQFVNVYLDGRHIRYLDGLDTRIPPGSRLHIFPSVAGG
jgi:molybdopterin synthase sulfur carrier subunit